MTKVTVRRTTVATVALLVSVSVLAGCGKSRDSSAVVDGLSLPSAAPAATTDVDDITWNLPGGEPTSLDPMKAFSGSDLQVAANVCESLLTLTDSGDVEPYLASSIDQQSPTEYVVHLREGVTFSDGSPLTADDVVFSLDRIRDPESGSYWGYFAQNLTSVVATDPQTVTIELSQADVIFYRMLATPLGQVVSQAYADETGDDFGSATGGVMCTGPYTLARWTAGDSIELTANENWWNRDQQPLRTESATFRFLTDDATVTSALLNGDLDGMFDIASSSLSQLLDTDRGTVYAGPSTRQSVLIPTRIGADSDSPLADPKIRQALAKSIDYAGLLSSVWAGLSKPLRTIVPPGGWGYGRNIYEAAYDEFTDPARDVDAAKALLAEAGNPNPKIVLAVPAEIPQYVSVGESIQSNAKDAGFDIELRALPTAEANALFSDQDARNEVDLFFSDYYSDIPDPTQLYFQIGIPDGASNFNEYDNRDVAGLLDQALGAADDTERATLTAEAQKIMTEDLVWIPLAYPLQSVFLNSRLGGATAAFPSVLYTPWLATIGGL